MERKGFVLKGTSQAVEMIIGQTTPVAEILEQLAEVLRRRGDVMARLPFVVEPGERRLTDAELAEFEQFFRAQGLDYQLPQQEPAVDPSEALFPEPHVDPTIVVDHTLRSGQSVTTGGNVLIVGDVNEGAEVHAAGSIYVMGTIRGVVSAGSSVTALAFEPSRMSVGDVEYAGEDRGVRDARRARTAFVEDGALHIDIAGKRR
ncbi:MAG TPA: septum site-determining protein MinC [Candidatus Cryosericum sp.]|nr:septum site-determining protein MinC [Candidatus Cryosericum sp.]